MNERLIFLEKEDEIDAVISILEKTNVDRVIFVIPKKAVFFESIFNAKILRSRSEELNKWIFIITADKKGRHLLNTVGIANFENLEQFGENNNFSSLKKENSKNNKKQKNKRRILKIDKIFQEDDDEKIDWKSIFFKPSKTLLILLTIATISLFFFVSVLALPGATIFIKPEKKTITGVVNLNILEKEKINSSLSRNGNFISGIPLEAEFEKEITFYTISKIFDGKNAQGKITVINSSNKSRSLMPKTRFQSESGIIYRINAWITIPPLKNGKNGEVEVLAVADEFDIFGEVVGEKGNLKERQKLTIPGLPLSGQRLVWGEIRQPMQNGISSFKSKVLEEDIELAKKSFQQKVLQQLQDDLNKYLKEKNITQAVDYQLVPDSKYIEKNIYDITLPENILNTNIKSFPVKGKIKVRTWIFNKNELMQALQEILEKETDPEMYLQSVISSSVVIDILERENKNGLKINAVTKGIEAFLIEPRTPAGMKFEKRVKEAILGKSSQEAENILINFKEISDVKISLWPFFTRKIPKLKENISIKLWNE